MKVLLLAAVIAGPAAAQAPTVPAVTPDIAILEAAARDQPADADAWLRLGLGLTTTGRYGEAEEALGYALRLAPNYADAHLARARVAYFEGRPREAGRRLAPALASEPESAEVNELSARIAEALAEIQPTWRVDAYAGLASLSAGLPAARSYGAALGRRLESGLTVSGGGEFIRQFGTDDTYWEAVIGSRRGYVALGGTPKADFRPRLNLRAGVYTEPRALGAGWSWQAGVDGGWARYVVGNVRTLTPLLTFSRGDDLSLTARWINVLDETDTHRTGYGVAGSWRFAPRLQALASWTDAPESSDGRTTDVRTTSLSVEAELASDLSVRMTGTRESRPVYSRDEVIVGMTRRF